MSGVQVPSATPITYAYHPDDGSATNTQGANVPLTSQVTEQEITSA